MLTKQAMYKLAQDYRELGINLALEQAGLLKLAISKNKRRAGALSSGQDAVKDTKKTIGKAVDTGAKAVKEVATRAKPLKKLEGAAKQVIKRVPTQHQGVANALLGKAKGFLRSKAITAVEPAYVAAKMINSEGRKQLEKEYPLRAPEPTSILDAAASPILDVVNFGTAPLSISGLAALSRTVDRSHKGSMVYQKELEGAAKKNDIRRIQQLVSNNPKYSPLF